jgi:molybdopterin/thiamine biosynthesis adenylyltransferase
MSGKYGLSISAEAKSIAVAVENDCVNAITFKQVPNFYSAIISCTDDMTAETLLTSTAQTLKKENVSFSSNKLNFIVVIEIRLHIRRSM